MPTYSWHLSSVPRRGDCLPPYNQPQFCHYGGERGRGETLLGEALHPFRVRKAIKSSRAEPDEPDGFLGGHSHLMHLHSQGPARPRAERTQPRQGGPAGAGAPTAAGWGCCWQCGPGPRHRGPVLQQTRPQRNPGLSVCSGPRWRVTTGVIVGVDLGCFAQTPGRSSGSPGSPGVGRSGVQRSGCGRPLSTQSRFK